MNVPSTGYPTATLVTVPFLEYPGDPLNAGMDAAFVRVLILDPCRMTGSRFMASGSSPSVLPKGGIVRLQTLAVPFVVACTASLKMRSPCVSAPFAWRTSGSVRRGAVESAWFRFAFQ
jgi:hypothetical protein